MATSSVPSVKARVMAIVAITISGLCGGLVGYAVTDLQCDNGSETLAAAVGLGSALLAAGGVSVVVNLALKAMSEWKTTERQQSARERFPIE